MVITRGIYVVRFHKKLCIYRVSVFEAPYEIDEIGAKLRSCKAY